MNKKQRSLKKSHSQILMLGILIFFLVPLTFSWSGSLQENQGKPGSQESRLENSTKSAIIDWICLKMNEIYVFPDVAKKMEEHIRTKLKNGDYNKISNPRAFVRQLRSDLVEISHDKHFNVTYAPESSLRLKRPDPEEDKKREEQRIRQWKYDNYYFKKVERMDGNVGYLRFDGFANTLYAGDTAVAALQFLLPEVKEAVGVWQISTSSKNSIIDINSGIDFVRSIAGRVCGGDHLWGRGSVARGVRRRPPERSR